MASTSNQESVQYIQLLNDSEIISVDSDEAETQEMIELDENEPENQSNIVDNLQIQDIQYLETEEISENDILIIHNDKQYIIPKKQLSDAENTIILETNDNNYVTGAHQSDNNDQQSPNNDLQSDTNDFNNIYYSENEFVVLKDGKLHFDTENKEIEEKLKDFQTSLSTFEEPEPEEMKEYEELGDSMDQIIGKNLLTGQKITLSGYMDKIRQKGIDEVSPSISRRSVVATPKLGCGGNEYVLIPPVNKKVVVGRTADGKKLVGRVLQIQKKISAMTQAPVHRPQRRPMQQQRPRPPPRPSPPPLPPVSYTPLLDSNISRTLSGLMDLDSVSRSLVHRQLIVKHVQRRSSGGKVVPGSRCVRFYLGRMVKGGATGWSFENVTPPKEEVGIDVVESGDRQTVSAGEEEGVEEVGETVQLFLTVTVDEYNKKKTKVSIPQLAQNSNKPRVSEPRHEQKPSDAHICQICGKKFQSLTSLRRHLTVHDPNSRPLQCLQCSSRFTDESSLKKHLILHTGLKPYTCEVCSKSFSHKSDLNFHLKIHNSEKKFKCQICFKSFHRHSNLLRHEEIHRSVAMETSPGSGGEGEGSGCQGDEEHKQPPYCCEVCGVQYNFISSLTRHIVTHHITSDGTDT